MFQVMGVRVHGHVHQLPHIVSSYICAGRRNCQTRLVKPCASSINSGDAFVLVVPDKVYVWLGEYCNVIEKAKANDVSNVVGTDAFRVRLSVNYQSVVFDSFTACVVALKFIFE